MEESCLRETSNSNLVAFSGYLCQSSQVWLKPECLLSSVKSTINPFHPLLKSHFGLIRGKMEKQRKQACFKTIQILKSAGLGRSPFCGQG